MDWHRKQKRLARVAAKEEANRVKEEEKDLLRKKQEAFYRDLAMGVVEGKLKDDDPPPPGLKHPCRGVYEDEFHKARNRKKQRGLISQVGKRKHGR